MKKTIQAQIQEAIDKLEVSKTVCEQWTEGSTITVEHNGCIEWEVDRPSEIKLSNASEYDLVLNTKEQPIEVIKPFVAARTPCPPKGARGIFVGKAERFYRVKFPLPMTDQDGAVWTTSGGDTEFMTLKFEEAEIKFI
jgi:hypothetical protein